MEHNYTQELIESNVDEVVNRYDTQTGLRLFMVATKENDGFSRDLSSIYGFMRMNPIGSMMMSCSKLDLNSTMIEITKTYNNL